MKVMISYSRISTFQSCPYKYYLRYIMDISTIPDHDANSGILCGSLIHKAIETDLETAINEYYNEFKLISDKQIEEVIKVQILYPKIMKILSQFKKQQHEVPFEVSNFRGFIDLIADKTLIDFKYSNNRDNYMTSPQLHIYCYFMRQLGYEIDHMAYLFIPKTQIRQKKTEDLMQFRQRLIETASELEPELVYVDYDDMKVNDLFLEAKIMLLSKDFPKNETKLCDWCEYQNYCKNKEDIMLLPKNEKKVIKVNTTPDMWLYGMSYSGKTVFSDSLDNVLFLNTDGNTDHIKSPVIQIKDEITVTGRLSQKVSGWNVFKDVVSELEKKQNDFKIIAVDLLEDLFELCRLHVYDQLKIKHESEAAFGKAYDMIKTEFLSTLKRLKIIGYQMIFISKEVKSEITKSNGEKLTIIKPNMQDKIANVVAGMVDITARVVAEGNDRFLSFKTSEYIFGGGRYNFGVEKIPLNKDEFLKILTKIQEVK